MNPESCMLLNKLLKRHFIVMNHHHSIKEFDCRDPNAHNQIVNYLKEIFRNQNHQLKKVSDLAQKIKKGVDGISPFLQQTTQIICPHCKYVCCISKHGYYNYEDLVYLYALNMKPPHYEFGREDTEPCQYLSGSGCTMERSVRPSGCNWYFCDSLLDHMEMKPEYDKFDDSLQDIASLWLAMMEKFAGISSSQIR